MSRFTDRYLAFWGWNRWPGFSV